MAVAILVYRWLVHTAYMRPPKSGYHRTTEQWPLGMARQSQSDPSWHNREGKVPAELLQVPGCTIKQILLSPPLPQPQTLKTAGNIRLPCSAAINPPWTESMALCPPSSSQLTLYEPGGKEGDPQPQPLHGEPSSKGSTALGMKGEEKGSHQVAGKA